MKKKIAILGSTGSIGKTLIKIIKKDKKNFEIILLTADKNYKGLLKQAKIFNVKNLIITDEKSYFKLKKKRINKIKIFNNFEAFNNIFTKKIDYVMSSISGISGLEPTLKIIKHTKKIAIANKEAIICGWSLIKKELNINKTQFIPVDSEHFSIYYTIKNTNINNLEHIYLTASGGPLKNLHINKFKNIKVADALNHPNWKMGQKISIDSATMMNKVFEIIEAHKIFNIPYKNLKILIHPKSYVHALIKFNDGMIKVIAHDTNMKIPIHNSLYSSETKFLKTKKIDFNKLNNLDFSKVDYQKFPLVKIISRLSEKNTLFETIIVAVNDELVKKFLQKKISFLDISKKMNKILSLNEFKKYKRIKPITIDKIVKLNDYVRFKINNLSI
jgi:1-deoxy-D-xylulose-5-phosphate reductoisomerase